MPPRLAKELELLRRHYPGLEFVESGYWFLIPGYPLPKDWNRGSTHTAFQAPPGYPGSAPYGFYVPSDLRVKEAKPAWQEPAQNRPPFAGEWAFFSWAVDGQWPAPTTDFIGGANLLSFTLSFADRFTQGA